MSRSRPRCESCCLGCRPCTRWWSTVLRKRRCSRAAGRRSSATRTCSPPTPTSDPGPRWTSGTTGNPKGVAYSHRSILLQSMSSATQNALRIGADDRILVVVPMFHATAWGYPYSAFWFGADIVLPDRFLKPRTIVRAIEEERITFANGVPTIWNDVLRLLRSEPGHDLSSLGRIVVGGAAVTRSLLEGFDAEVGVPILQGWGMTETSPLVTVAWPPPGAGPDEATSARLSQGRILAGVDIRLVNPDSLDLLTADGHTVGELELRGPWISGGY